MPASPAWPEARKRPLMDEVEADIATLRGILYQLRLTSPGRTQALEALSRLVTALQTITALEAERGRAVEALRDIRRDLNCAVPGDYECFIGRAKERARLALARFEHPHESPEENP